MINKHPMPPGDVDARTTPDQIVQRLMQGNARHVAHEGALRRRSLDVGSPGLEPIVAVLACSDLCSAPDEVFDLPLGQLYVIQTAANHVGEGVLAEVALAHARHAIELLIVLSHSPCGVVRGCEASDAPEGLLAREIRAAGRSREHDLAPGESPLEHLAKAHVLEMCERLRHGLSEDCAVRVVAAHLDESSGRVTLLPAVEAGH